MDKKQIKLIDAKLLEEHYTNVIKDYESGNPPIPMSKEKCKLLEGAFRDVLARIKSQPAAYGVDKVVEDIEKVVSVNEKMRTIEEAIILLSENINTSNYKNGAELEEALYIIADSIRHQSEEKEQIIKHLAGELYILLETEPKDTYESGFNEGIRKAIEIVKGK